MCMYTGTLITSVGSFSTQPSLPAGVLMCSQSWLSTVRLSLTSSCVPSGAVVTRGAWVDASERTFSPSGVSTHTEWGALGLGEAPTEIRGALAPVPGGLAVLGVPQAAIAIARLRAKRRTL